MNKKVRVDARPMTDAEMREINGRKSNAGNKINAFLDSKLARAVGPTLGRIVENHGVEGIKGIGSPLLALAARPVITVLSWAAVAGGSYLAANALFKRSKKRKLTAMDRMLNATPYVGGGMLMGYAARKYAPDKTTEKIGGYTAIALFGAAAYELLLRKSEYKKATLPPLIKSGPIKDHMNPVTPSATMTGFEEVERVPLVYDRIFGTYPNLALKVGSFFGIPGCKDKFMVYKFDIMLDNKSKGGRTVIIEPYIINVDDKGMPVKTVKIEIPGKTVQIDAETVTTLHWGIFKLTLDNFVKDMAGEGITGGKTYIQFYIYSTLDRRNPVDKTKEIDMTNFTEETP